MSFGRRLKEALKYRQISQVDFAKSKKVNMTPQNINQYIKDKRNPSKKMLQKLADGLELQCKYTAGGAPYFCDSGGNIQDDSKIKKFNQAQFSDAIEDAVKTLDPNASVIFVNQEFSELSKDNEKIDIEDALAIARGADSLKLPKELIPLKNIYQHLDETEKDIFLECISKIGKLNVEGKKEILKLADVFSESEKYKRIDGLAEIIKGLEPCVTKLVPTFGSEKDVVAQNIQENKKEQ